MHDEHRFPFPQCGPRRPGAAASDRLRRQHGLGLALLGVLCGAGCGSEQASPRMAADLFLARADLVIGVAPKAVVINDFDRDGQVDMVAARATGSGSLSMLIARGNNTFARAEINNRFGDTPFDLVLADLDGDGRTDAAAPLYLGGELAVLWGADAQDRLAIPSEGSHPYALVALDLDGKNGRDLLTTTQVGKTLNVFLNQGSRVFGTAVKYTFDTAPAGFAVGDFDGSGPASLDVAIALPGSNKVRVWPGNATGGFDTTRATDLSVGKNPITVVAGLLNADSLPDLIVANAGERTISVLLGSSAGFGSAQTYSVGDNPTGIAIADLDQDGIADVVVTNRSSNNLTILRGTGTGALQAIGDLATREQPEGLAIGDVTNDGLPDIAVANVDADVISVFAGKAKK